jgi:hypothetical protein
MEGEEGAAIGETVMERHQTSEVSLIRLQIVVDWRGTGFILYKQNHASKINVFLLF